VSGTLKKAQVAQLVEQRTENPRVGGSNPPLGTSLDTTTLRFGQLRDHRPKVLKSTEDAHAKCMSAIETMRRLRCHCIAPACSQLELDSDLYALGPRIE